mgnify:CR=1 FL=1
MDFSQILRSGTTTLLIVAILQSIYWIYLLRGASNKPSDRRNRAMMPSNPRLIGGQQTSEIEAAGDYTDNLRERGGFQGMMIVLDGMPDLANRNIRMPKNSFTIGRFYNPDEDILVAIDERSISRRHARFTSEGSNFYLTDIGSSYGTSISSGGQNINLSPDQREQVFDGDEIVFGNTVRLKLSLPGPARSS